MTIYRTDYQTFAYLIPSVLLEIDLDPQATHVTSTLTVVRAEDAANNAPLELDGEDIEFVSLQVDGQPWPASSYVLDDRGLTILGLPKRCTITIKCINRPANNTSLMGLYVSGDSLFTQCEAQGFRRITYFADRPDVMSTYTVSLRGDKKR
jgi:aminopeptidase N